MLISEIVIGIILLIKIVGLFCTLNSNWFIVTFPVLTALCGAAMLLTGLRKIQWTIDCVRL